MTPLAHLGGVGDHVPVQSMEMAMLKWLVAFVVIYTSWTMYASWKAARGEPESQPRLAEDAG